VQGSKTTPGWTPWKPICDKCGNLQTTVITKIDGTKISYKCQDYAFEKFTAKGCGHEGTSELKKANGKLVWKSEWAAQWKRWNVCTEGAGKEYESKNSAFWVNAEIAERVLDFPRPEPIFYEHLVIGGVKMSASLGNVIYPRDWLQLSKPETLKYLYMKRLMKTRSFEWKDVPILELELDRVIADAQAKKTTDEKEHEQNKKFLRYVQVKGRKLVPMKADYALCAFLSGFYSEEQVLEKLREQGQIATGSKEEIAALKERIKLAAEWQKKFAPEESRVEFSEKLPEKEASAQTKELFAEAAKIIKKTGNAEEIQQQIYELGKKKNLPAGEMFKEFYQAIISKERGPKLGQLIVALGKEKVAKKLEQIATK
jgi:lysyl-tRNA synthetase class 1